MLTYFIDIQKICRKINHEIQKPKCVLDYNKYAKEVDRTDQYLNYYINYKKNVKCSKKVALYNCASFNLFRIYRHFNGKSKSLRLHDFLIEYIRSLIKG